MKAVVAIFVFALCNSAILVQGGIIDDITNLPNLALNTVRALIENLIGILTGLIAQLGLPNIDLGLNATLENIKVGVGSIEIELLEDGNILDLKVDNVTLAFKNVDINAKLHIDDELPLLGNVSIREDIAIKVNKIQIGATVELRLGLKPVVSDLINIIVKVDAGVEIKSDIDIATLQSVLDIDVPAKIEAEIGKQLKENKGAVIAQLNRLL